MHTITTQQRRALLANAHARYHATNPADKAKVFEAALRNIANVIPEGVTVLEVTTEGDTTVLTKLSNGEGILLDAYGNLQRGML